ncbi:ribosome recycling factor [Erysipelotrichaceae bacterium]|nr:ribosome recycling factor [Erysipelotrichaceae bacterium]
MPSTILTEMNQKMDKAIERFASDLSTINTGSANPQVLNRISVEYYGTPTPLNQVAQVSAPDAHSLIVAPFDKTVLPAIETSIQQANLGFNPTNDGNIIRINIPALTKERRQEFAKQIKTIGETAKIAIRNIRRDANEGLKKLDLPTDELKGNQDDVQTATDTYVKKVDTMIVSKEKDVMTI